MAAVLEDQCVRDIGGPQQRIERMDTRWGDISRQCVLVPVWRTALQYDGSRWELLVNGRTGEVSGEIPRSLLKLSLLVLALSALFVLVISLLSIQYSPPAP